MYDVYLKYNNQIFPIHNQQMKLKSGKIKQGINCIDSFPFEILPNNIGFNYIHEFKTLIEVYNTKMKRYEFRGRVLQAPKTMSDNGLISKSVVCESYLGYLQDSVQEYLDEMNWTPSHLLGYLIAIHNSQLEEEKAFKLGTVFTEENIYCGIQRESTYECIMNKIIDKIGGEIQLRFEEDGTYIDIVEERGTTKATTIELSKNMKSITQENDSSNYITRLIPLGAKIKVEETDEDGNVSERETEERIDISSVNDGLNYIDDEIAIQKYGLHIRYEYWDDVHEAAILKTKAIKFLSDNNKVLQKYSVNAVDLSLIGLDIDSIDVSNYYPVKNKLLNIDDTLRVITKEIDIVNESNSNFEIGDKFKTLIDIEIEKNNQINQAFNTIEVIEKNYVTNKDVMNIENTLISSINQNSQSIQMMVEENYTSKSAFEEYMESVSTQFTQTSESFQMTFTEVINSITTVDGKVNDNYNELIKYIQFKDGSITLGEVDNPLTLTLSNNRLSFKQNGIEVAYISDNKLYIYDGEFLNSLKIGRFIFIPRENGNLSFTYV